MPILDKERTILKYMPKLQFLTKLDFIGLKNYKTLSFQKFFIPSLLHSFAKMMCKLYYYVLSRKQIVLLVSI